MISETTTTAGGEGDAFPSVHFQQASEDYTLSKFANSGDLRVAMLGEIATLRAANKRLATALESVIDSWDRRSVEREHHSTHPDIPGGYWTPTASMVDAEVIAIARAALTSNAAAAANGGGE